jgi:hypothetical protein
MKQAIEFIKSEIKSATSRSREIRKQIHAASGIARWQLWQEKRWHGDGTRIKLLAYGCLRGRTYELLESKCRVGNEPSATAILREIQSAWPEAAPDCDEWTLDRVRGWLTRSQLAQTQAEAELAPAALVA